MTATDDMVDEAHIVRSQCLYAQASSLARTVLNLPVCITAVANIKYKQPVTVGDKLIAKPKSCASAIRNTTYGSRSGRCGKKYSGQNLS